MSFMNNYVPEEKKGFDIPDGDYRVRILKAENATSRSGLNMHAITLQVEGSKEHYLHYPAGELQLLLMGRKGHRGAL